MEKITGNPVLVTNSGPETAGRGYPHRYYCSNPYSLGESCYIVPGCTCFYGGRGLTYEQLHTNPAWLNRQEGITPPQEAAMDWAARQIREGYNPWRDPHADPMMYNAAGEYLGR